MAAKIIKSFHPAPVLFEAPYENGKCHGIVKRFSPSGKLEAECPCVEGKLHGVCKYYDTSGKLESTATWDKATLVSFKKVS